MDFMRRATLSALAVALGLGLGGATQPAAAGACKEISGVSNKGCVTKRDLKKNAVTSGKVKNESLTGKDIEDGSIGAADLAPDAVIGPTYVFLASESNEGAFGIAAWDALCQADAEGAGLAPGVYRAWLSTSSFDARDMLPPGPFVDSLGRFVALNKGDLLDGRILTAISHPAPGLPNTLVFEVFTGTGADGAFLAPNCADWTSSENLAEGRVGSSSSTDSGWTEAGTDSCADSHRVYCFQVE